MRVIDHAIDATLAPHLVDLERLNPEAAHEAREVELADRVAPRVLARVWPFFLLAGQALFLFLKPPR